MPYVTGGPVEAGPIIPRPEEEELMKHIANQSLYIPLCCARQTGKTTLMYQLRHRLRNETYGVAYLYLGNLSELTEQRFYQHICAEFYASLKGCFGDAQAQANIEKVQDQPAFLKYMGWIAAKSDKCRKVILMLDEVGGVPKALAQSFWGGLRSMNIQKGDYQRIMFVLAGELDMNHLATSNNSPLSNVCISPFVDLRDFSKDEVRKLVYAGLPQDESLVDEIESWTAGHPYLTQKLCALVENEIARYPGYLKTRPTSELVANLVKVYFQQVDDPNLVHLFNALDAEPKYRERVRQLLDNGPRKPTPRNRELAVLGLVKLNDNGLYAVRNRIYEAALRNYLEDYAEEK